MWRYLVHVLERELVLDLERDLPRDLVRGFDLTFMTPFFATILNDLCVAEERIEGTVPIVSALWLRRTRQNIADQKTATTGA